MHPNRPYCFFAALVGILFLPRLPLLYFAPYLVLTLYRLPLHKALWQVLACGLILDMLSSADSCGLTTISYLITLLLLQGPRRHFFEDKASTFFLLTLLFSLYSSLIRLLGLLLFSHIPPLTTAVAEVCSTSLLNALYGYLLLLPFQLLALFRRMHPIHK